MLYFFRISIGTHFITHHVVGVTQPRIDFAQQIGIIISIIHLNLTVFGIRFHVTVYQSQNLIAMSQMRAFHKASQTFPVFRFIAGGEQRVGEMVLLAHVFFQRCRTPFSQAYIVCVRTFGRSVSLDTDRKNTGISIFSHGIYRSKNLLQFLRITAVFRIHFRTVYRKIDVG